MSKNKKKILIIEDEIELVKNLKLLLEDDYQVLSTVTGEEGLVKAKKEIPNLILLDLVLPTMDGLAVLSKLKKNRKTKNIPIIVLTNLGDNETISKIIKAGGKKYLVKSDYSLPEVKGKIKEVLG